ncbi:MAG: hypothetical protein D6772_11880, partial [Bacteroidetes bacterium]
LPDNRIIHVANKVQIDAIDHYGIFSYELGRYTHRLRVVRRIFSPDQIKEVAAARQPVAVRESLSQQALF